MSDDPLRLPNTCLDPDSEDEEVIRQGSKCGAESEEEVGDEAMPTSAAQALGEHIDAVRITDSPEASASTISPNTSGAMAGTGSDAFPDSGPRATGRRMTGKQLRSEPNEEIYHGGEFNPISRPFNNSQVYGVVVHNQSKGYTLHLECLPDYMTREEFDKHMKEKNGRYAKMKVCFLPLLMNEQHQTAIHREFDRAMRGIAATHSPKVFPQNKKTPLPELIIRILPNLLCKCVVGLTQGDEMPHKNAIRVLTPLYKLYRWAVTKNGMQPKVEVMVKKFVEQEAARHKKECKDIGEWLALYVGSRSYSWQSVRDVYLEELFRRIPLYSVQNDYTLALSSQDKALVLNKIFTGRSVALRLTAILSWFAQHVDQPTEDGNHSNPRDNGNLAIFGEVFTQVYSMTTWQQWFQLLGYEAEMSDAAVFERLRTGIEYAIDDECYNTSRGDWPYIKHVYPEGTRGPEQPLPILQVELGENNF